jgi:hypothetical protein
MFSSMTSFTKRLQTSFTPKNGLDGVPSICYLSDGGLRGHEFAQALEQ